MWDSYRCYITDNVKAELRSRRVDYAIIPGGTTWPHVLYKLQMSQDELEGNEIFIEDLDTEENNNTGV